MKVKTKELQKIVEMSFLPFGGENFIEAPRLLVGGSKVYFNNNKLASVCAGAIFDDMVIEDGSIEKIDLTKTLFDMIKGFRGKETFISLGDDDRIYMNSANRKVNEPATEHDFNFANVKPHYIWNEYGFVPDSFTPKVTFNIDSNQLKNLYKSDEYQFIATEDGNISIQLTYEGYTDVQQQLEPKEDGKFENKTIEVDAEYFNSVLAVMDGEIKISFDDLAIGIYQEKENQKASYFILCIKE